MIGTVKVFNIQKGYGFIEYEANKYIFVHFSAIKMDGFKALQAGEKVEFDIMNGLKGQQAVNVKRVSFKQ